ncbi:hypothetical protein [Paenibacillus sp. S150]|uniref:hypothetical protein n=1 Tax=Paenibacillus sp. S150 TaxID=2749826 RepID=UPI001C58C5F6|nr:hypothetical protein [Paenibacillus sp. S150]MBW4081275.1 hypothetical protein [Paenibacillus sp. S150]
MIEYVSCSEHELIVNAREKYDDFLLFSEEAIILLTKSFVSVHPKCDVFLLFFSQIQKALTLSLLATIRKHDVQSSLMLRIALESSIYAGYALDKTNVFDFVNIDENGFAHENENVKKKALKWIDDNYNHFSITFKNYKDMINSSAAHSNILSAFNNFSIGIKDSITINLFDNDSTEMVKERLWWIGNITFCIVDFLRTVIKDYPMVKLYDNFNQELFDISRLNDFLEDQLLKNPNYKRTRDIQIHSGE